MLPCHVCLIGLQINNAASSGYVLFHDDYYTFLTLNVIKALYDYLNNVRTVLFSYY